MDDLKEYFAKAVDADAGDKVIIPCVNTNEQESIRVQMFKMRKKYAAVVDRNITRTLGIYAAKLESALVVVLEKRDMHETQAFIIKRSGELVPIVPTLLDEGLAHFVSRAIEDGLEIEEIIISLEGVYSQAEVVAEYVKQGGSVNDGLDRPEGKGAESTGD